MVLRSPRNWTSRMGVCAVAFALTGIAVYLVGVASTGQPETTCTARAAIYYQAPPADAADASSKPTTPDPATIREQIVADANLGWALRRSGPEAGASSDPAGSPPSSEAMARARENLRVTVGKTATPGQLEIAIAFTGRDAQEATRLVDRLAERYAREQRAGAEAPARDAYLRARDAADLARRRWTAARAQRDTFLQHHFQQLGAEAGRLAAWSPARGPTAPPSDASRFVPAPPVPVRIARPGGTQLTDNPEWADLKRQVENLMRQRSELLTERTALHPSVRDVEGRIADLQQRLAGLPHRVAEPQPPTDGHPSQSPPRRHGEPDVPPSSPGQIAEEHLAAVRGYSERTEGVDRAREDYEQLAAAERRAWQGQFRSPQIDLKLAGQCEIAGAPERRSQLPLVALVAGLAAAASIGIISFGSGDPPFASIAEVQASLPVPVIGRIPAPIATDASRAHAQAPAAKRPSRALFHVVLTTICVGAVAVVVLGYWLGW